jgi:hypothetical protein
MFKNSLLTLLLLVNTAAHAVDLDKEKKQLEKYKTSLPVLLWKSTKILLRSEIYKDSVAIQKLFREFFNTQQILVNLGY